jgi:nucleoside-diphosphate-sugar epimerase
MDIAILGAPGCVGRTVIRNLLDSSQYRIKASYRTEEEIPKGLQNGRLIWKQVDLLDQSSAENFLRRSEILIHLIHSLGAKDFEQLDVKLANAAGNAASKAGIKKIIYLGGIIPHSRYVSPHLISRMKTGEALASYGIPVGEVRASILLATCSMSYRVVYFLSKRLPIMITPRWLNSLCAPIAIEDAVSVIAALIHRDIKEHEIFEIGSDIVRYGELISLCGEAIRGVRNLVIPVPLFATHLSALWIQLMTGVPNSVGIALAEGLKSDTIPSKNRFREVTGRDPIPLQSVLKRLAGEMRKRTD